MTVLNPLRDIKMQNGLELKIEKNWLYRLSRENISWIKKWDWIVAGKLRRSILWSGLILDFSFSENIL